MSEPILFALVQLFAIVAASKHEKLSTNARLIIKAYFKQYISGKELEEYLLLYDELFLFHEFNGEETEWASTETLNKIEKICLKISSSLQQKDKLIIFIKFIEFVEEIRLASENGGKDSSQAFEFYKLIKSAFGITNSEYTNICAFVLGDDAGKLNKNRVLAIAADDHSIVAKYQHITRPRLNGHILIIHLKSVDLLIGRYIGSDDIYLNGHYIYPKHSFIISHGSILKSQKTTPVYYADVAAYLVFSEQKQPLQFYTNNLEYTFKNSTNGIKPFTFVADSGELVGVMGGSGAGKSTLLSLLNGSIKPDNGEILINGHDLQSEKHKLKSIIGYIPQDDLLIDELTVFQNLYFNAKLCFSNYSNFKIIRVILKVLQDIDLMEIRDLVVGNPLNKVISGGQRKRLNIALELLREPAILFADEPTSGLSSMDSEMVMLLLKEQTIKGKLVIVNIHQPSSGIFKLFDKLLLLDKGGYPIYYGNPIDSISYFKGERKHVNPTESECLSCGYVNPEQLFQITEAKTISKHGKVTDQRISSPYDWYEIFKKKLQPVITSKVVKGNIPDSNFNIPSLFKQFKIFSLRNVFIKLTNKQYVLLNLIEAPMLALILAFLTRYSSKQPYIYGDNKNLVAYMFMSVVVALFLGMMVSAEEIIKDRKILKREAFLTLSRKSYIHSKILFLFLLSALQTMLYVLVGNLILEVNHLAFSYWLILFTTSCFANMVGLNLSAGMNSVVTIYISIPFFLVPQILLSGVIVPFDTLNRSISASGKVPIVGDLMASRWAFEALAVNEYKNNPYSKHFYEYDKAVANLNFANSYLLPAINERIDALHYRVKQEQPTKISNNDFAILANEIEILEQQAGFKKGLYSAELAPEFLTNDLRVELHSYMDSLKNYFANARSAAVSMRDKNYEKHEKQFGMDYIFALKKNSLNTGLEEWVKNKRSGEQIITNNNGFIRKKDPIYMDAKSKNGRAHFYAPTKKVGNININTVWFNIIAIWLMSILLYVALLNNWLLRFINVMQKQKR